MHCVIYKSRRKTDTYLYVAAGFAIEELPETVRGMLGELSKVMELELTPERRLARESVTVVRTNLLEHGFHVQFPPPPGQSPAMEVPGDERLRGR